MDFGKWKSEVLIPLAHRQVFHWTRSSLRRVSSSVLHYCAAKIINNHKITKKFERKILKNRKNERYSFEFQNYFVILDRKAIFLCIKAVRGIGKCRGLRFGDRSQFHVLLWIAFKELRLRATSRFYDPSSGAKVRRFFEITKLCSRNIDFIPLNKREIVA